MTQTSDGGIRDSIGRARSNERSHQGEITIHSLQLGEPLVGGADLGDGSVLPQQSTVDPQAPPRARRPDGREGVADKKDGPAWWRILFMPSWLRARNPASPVASA